MPMLLCPIADPLSSLKIVISVTSSLSIPLHGSFLSTPHAITSPRSPVLSFNLVKNSGIIVMEEARRPYKIHWWPVIFTTQRLLSQVSMARLALLVLVLAPLASSITGGFNVGGLIQDASEYGSAMHSFFRIRRAKFRLPYWVNLIVYRIPTIPLQWSAFKFC